MSEDQRARRPVQPFPRLARNIPVALVFFALCLAAGTVIGRDLLTPEPPPPACSPQTTDQVAAAAEEFERVHVTPSAGTSPYVGYDAAAQGDGYVLVISTDGPPPPDAPECIARTPVRYEEEPSSRGS